ncbi:LysE family translocator [Photobacterium ganghwense]|uniref:Threonine transporter n=1 Tax=Photobacterium ganghwense TaxID=320778 RepID=A0A0J1HFV6_9GAMM|nr:LysE family transporter [Photobacterium ganghwense]KLV10521.1 threonine transporter [Photobacterium ganghwense]PSU09576.1 threonine transporter [Photobacterium ganghwense]
MVEQYLFVLPMVSLLLFGAMTPGPSFVLVAQTAMSKSRIEAVSIALGLGLGATIFAFLASSGLITLFKVVPELYMTFKVLGGLYLCYLGAKMWRTSKDSLSANTATEPGRPKPLKAMSLGLITQLSNPKTAIVFSSVFAALLPADVPEHTTWILAFSVFLLNFSWYAFVATLLSSAKAQRGYLRFKSYINKGAGLLMGSIGSKFVMDGFRP